MNCNKAGRGGMCENKQTFSLLKLTENDSIALLSKLPLDGKP